MACYIHVHVKFNGQITAADLMTLIQRTLMIHTAASQASGRALAITHPPASPVALMMGVVVSGAYPPAPVVVALD